MAKVQVSPVKPTSKGVVLTYAAPNGTGSGNGDAVRPNSVVLYKNTSGGAITATLISGGLVGDLAVADPTVSIPVGDFALGPFERVFPQIAGTDAGWVEIEYSSVTNLTRAVISSD
jgi:hypothetical protein